MCLCVCVARLQNKTELKSGLGAHTPRYIKVQQNSTTIKAARRILIEIISGILINNMSHKNMLQNILLGFVLYKFSSASHIFYTLHAEKLTAKRVS